MTEKKKSEALVPTAKELELAYAALLNGEPLPTAGDPEVVSRMIVERILSAETFEEAFAPQKLPAWRDVALDRTVLVQGFHLNNSTMPEGQGAAIYAIVDLVDTATGEQMTVTCGGRNVLAQLIKSLEKGWLGRPVRMTSKATAEGYRVLWLEAVLEGAAV